MWYKNLDRSSHRFVTIHACDRQTDGQTERIVIASSLLHSMQRGENVLLDKLRVLIAVSNIMKGVIKDEKINMISKFYNF